MRKNYFNFDCRTAMHVALDPGPSNSFVSWDFTDNEVLGIREVWACNMENEFKVIRRIVDEYNYVAMDTEFPGTVAQPVNVRSFDDYQYKHLKVNVDMTKIIQLGLTFLNKDGKPRPGCSTWQFNFKFCLQDDMYAENSINFLKDSGIQFEKHEREGIDHFEFAELLMTSGVVFMDNIKMITFQGGFDFGYLLKLLTGKDLPGNLNEFLDLLKTFFPVIYDIKYIMNNSCVNLRGGLENVAEQVEARRFGHRHQAGSDSLLTGAVFFRMRKLYFKNDVNEEKFINHLYGSRSSLNPNINEEPDQNVEAPNPAPPNGDG